MGLDGSNYGHGRNHGDLELVVDPHPLGRRRSCLPDPSMTRKIAALIEQKGDRISDFGIDDLRSEAQPLRVSSFKGTKPEESKIPGFQLSSRRLVRPLQATSPLFQRSPREDRQ